MLSYHSRRSAISSTKNSEQTHSLPLTWTGHMKSKHVMMRDHPRWGLREVPATSEPSPHTTRMHRPAMDSSSTLRTGASTGRLPASHARYHVHLVVRSVRPATTSTGHTQDCTYINGVQWSAANWQRYAMRHSSRGRGEAGRARQK